MMEMRVIIIFDHHNKAHKEEIIITQGTVYKVATLELINVISSNRLYSIKRYSFYVLIEMKMWEMETKLDRWT